MAPATRKRPAEGFYEVFQSPRKVMKKTAVTKTKDRDVIKIIESNVANSLLLSLPLEIRETILNYILGNKCIHVKLKTVAERYENFVTWNVDIKNIVDRKFRLGDTFRTHVCDLKPGVPFNPSIKHASSCTNQVLHRCHVHCKPAWRATTSQQRNTLDLSVLGSCRQLYQEAHQVLWTSNTFVLDDRFSLSAFTSKLNSGQKRKLRSIHICAQPRVCEHDCRPTCAACALALRPLSQAVTNAIGGLKHIELDIAVRIGFYLSYNNEVKIKAGRAALNVFRPMQALSLQTANINLSHMSREFQLDPYYKDPQRLDFDRCAQEFSALLLNSNGAQAAKVERKAENERVRLRTEEKLIRGWKDSRSYFQWIQRGAKHCIRRYEDFYEREKDNLESFAEDSGVTRKEREKRSLLQHRLFVHEIAADHAQDRLKRWDRANRNKREDTDRRLASIGSKKRTIDLDKEEIGVELGEGNNI